jgi:hypothetical protein
MLIHAHLRMKWALERRKVLFIPAMSLPPSEHASLLDRMERSLLLYASL